MMKKLRKMIPLFLMMCLFCFAAGCGSGKENVDPEDMAGNTVTESRPPERPDGAGEGAVSETEAFDGSETDAGDRNNSVTDPKPDEAEESASTSMDIGEAIDDAGHAAKDVVEDAGKGVTTFHQPFPTGIDSRPIGAQKIHGSDDDVICFQHDGTLLFSSVSCILPRVQGRTRAESRSQVQ